MNKTAIKNYAIWARVQLIESCKQRAFEYGVTEDGNYTSNLKTIGSRILTELEVEQRNQLVGQIKLKGYAQVMEEAAYTWFNRFIALRFMEVNGYLPSKVRVFTDAVGVFKPEILKEAMTVELEGIERTVVIDFLERQDNEALYKYLIITQCNALSAGLPYMFETIANWTELLFPANLLRSDSVVGRMVTDIPEEDWTDAVQILGWLYQYYYNEPKDAKIMAHNQYKTNDIPYVTQLFTPDWIVRYMVENSLGRLWCEGHKDFDKSQWKYYIDEAKQEPEVEAELVNIRAEYSQIKPEEIKVIDPCMGSGHILVYAFDVLMQIYTSAGWSERDAARSIIENNLYGLDIDDRAGQLSYFAVMMKARKYDRRIMSLDIKPNVMSILDSSFMTDEFIDFVAGNDARINADLRQIKEVFTDAKEYGSILKVPSFGYEAIFDRISDLQNTIVEDIFQIQHITVAVDQLRPLIRQAMIMSHRYDVVVTNPPYMNSSLMPNKLKLFINREYSIAKNDLFSTFIVKAIKMGKQNGFIGMLTPYVWMFISSYENLRLYVNEQCNIDTLVQLEYNGFEAACVPVGAFSLRITKCRYKGEYIRLTDFRGADNQAIKTLEAVSNRNCGYRYSACQNDFAIIPGSPIAYWMSESIKEDFIKGKWLKDIADIKQGLKTGDNNRFLRLWFEISSSKFSIYNGTKWFPCNKGGDYRRWYGNNDYVIDWENDGFELKNFRHPDGRQKSRPQNLQYQFRKGLTYTNISSSKFGIRYCPAGFAFDAAGSMIFTADNNILYLLGLLSSKTILSFTNILSPTMTFEVGQISLIPFIEKHSSLIDNLVRQNILLAKDEYDGFETSWDFEKHPLV